MKVTEGKKNVLRKKMFWSASTLVFTSKSRIISGQAFLLIIIINSWTKIPFIFLFKLHFTLQMTISVFKITIRLNSNLTVVSPTLQKNKKINNIFLVSLHHITFYTPSWIPGSHQHIEQPVVLDHTASSQNEVHARNDPLNTCESPNKHLN